MTVDYTVPTDAGVKSHWVSYWIVVLNLDLMINHCNLPMITSTFHMFLKSICT